MTAAGPTDEQTPPVAQAPTPPVDPALARADRMSAANMVRSLALLVVICLAVVGWLALGRSDIDPVREIDPGGTIAAVADEADFPLEVPQDLPAGYRPTDTDVTTTTEGAAGRLTFGIDYVTPHEDYAGFVISDDPGADSVTGVLDDVRSPAPTTIGGREWTRATTKRGETVLLRTDGGVTVLVTGDAGDDELETMAAAITPYTR